MDRYTSAQNDRLYELGLHDNGNLVLYVNPDYATDFYDARTWIRPTQWCGLKPLQMPIQANYWFGHERSLYHQPPRGGSWIEIQCPFPKRLGDGRNEALKLARRRLGSIHGVAIALQEIVYAQRARRREDETLPDNTPPILLTSCSPGRETGEGGALAGECWPGLSSRLEQIDFNLVGRKMQAALVAMGAAAQVAAVYNMEANTCELYCKDCNLRVAPAGLPNAGRRFQAYGLLTPVEKFCFLAGLAAMGDQLVIGG